MSTKILSQHLSENCPLKGLTGTRKILEDAIRHLLQELSVWAAACQTDGDISEAVLARQLSGALAGRAPREHMPICVQHDVIDDYNAVRAILRAANLPENFAYCPFCIRETKE
jgi:hypothetical protein